MEFYNQVRPGESDSAGTLVDAPGQQLFDRKGAGTIIGIMKTYGIDMTNNVRRQLDENMAKQYDKLIVMAEPETVPAWLRHDPKAEIWTIPDPKGQDVETTTSIVKQVKGHVDTLIASQFPVRR